MTDSQIRHFNDLKYGFTTESNTKKIEFQKIRKTNKYDLLFTDETIVVLFLNMHDKFLTALLKKFSQASQALDWYDALKF